MSLLARMMEAAKAKRDAASMAPTTSAPPKPFSLLSGALGMQRPSAQMLAHNLSAAATAANAATPTADAAATADTAGAKKARRGEYGTDAERWSWRSSREAIAADLAKGCACGCIEKMSLKYSLTDIVAQRGFHAEESANERRSRFLLYLEDNHNPAKSIGYDLHLKDTSDEVCINGFSYYHGFPIDWVYAMIRRHKVRAHAQRACVGGACDNTAFARPRRARARLCVCVW